MALNAVAENSMLDHLTGLVGYLSLHSADPGATGANEVSGSPYARKAISWDDAADGETAISAAVTFDVPGGTTVGWVGMWSASSGGTFYGSDAITSEVFGADGTLTITTGELSIA